MKVSILGTGWKHGTDNIAMDYYPDGDLLTYLIAQPECCLQEPEARRVFHQLTDGVQFLHSLDIAHLDLKCENMVFDAGHNIRIIGTYTLQFLLLPAIKKYFVRITQFVWIIILSCSCVSVRWCFIKLLSIISPQCSGSWDPPSVYHG